MSLRIGDVYKGGSITGIDQIGNDTVVGVEYPGGTLSGNSIDFILRTQVEQPNIEQPVTEVTPHE